MDLAEAFDEFPFPVALQTFAFEDNPFIKLFSFISTLDMLLKIIFVCSLSLDLYVLVYKHLWSYAPLVKGAKGMSDEWYVNII